LCDVPDGSSDYRTIPNVTFTVCNRHEFHDLRHFLLKLWLKRNPPIIYTHPVLSISIILCSCSQLLLALTITYITTKETELQEFAFFFSLRLPF